MKIPFDLSCGPRLFSYSFSEQKTVTLQGDHLHVGTGGAGVGRTHCSPAQVCCPHALSRCLGRARRLLSKEIRLARGLVSPRAIASVPPLFPPLPDSFLMCLF